MTNSAGFMRLNWNVKKSSGATNKSELFKVKSPFILLEVDQYQFSIVQNNKI
jgi:hypothetical protein